MSKHYDFVYGSALSTNTLAMMPVLTAAHIPKITSGQSDKLLAQNSTFIFMNSTPSSVYDATLAKYAIDKKASSASQC